ncbi:hypothetical protein [Nocardiopsis sp. LOL_012]|uniref:hypothetical protein n=1 Tax=Nocardiopsis sp. LOL_012 TaxID=3345409 RepID=UPI003A8763AD
MIVATAVCPHPPLLMRELTGIQDAAADLRGVCVSAVSSLLSVPDLDVVVVVGGGDASGEGASGGDPAHLYAARPRAEGERLLPLSLAVAHRLLRAVDHGVPVETATVAWDAPAGEIAALGRTLARRAPRVGLLVMGDGGTRWGVMAPGHLEGATVDVDRVVGEALAAGDARALLDVDPRQADEQRVGGRAALQVMAAAVAEGTAVPRPEPLYHDAPFGITYFVAVWSCDC